MKRMLILLAIAATPAATLVTSAQAAVVTNDTVSQPWSGWVSCANGGAGELVNGTIDVHNLVTETTNGKVASWQFQFQPHGGLTGTITGDTYRLVGVTRGIYHQAQQGDKDVLTYVNTYGLVGPGTGNNLRVREVAHVTINDDQAVVEHDDFTIDCA